MARQHDAERGQSAVIAIVLIVGLVTVTSIIILLAGGAVVEDSKEQAETTRVENSFRELDSQIDSVAYGSTDAAQTDLDLRDRGSGTIEQRNTGQIVVTLDGRSGSTEVLNSTTGTILYTDDKRTIGYQSSAVWRGTGNGTTMISAPRMQYNFDRGENPTLEVLVTKLEGDLGGTTSTVSVQRGPDSPRQNDVNEVMFRLVRIEITSQFYVGWGEYFSAILDTDTAVTYDHSNDTVIIQALPGSATGGIPGGVVKTATAENLFFGQLTETDSYDSRVGDYSTSANGTGLVLAEGDVELGNNMDIKGDVITGGHLLLNNHVTVHEDVQVGGNLTFKSGATQAEIRNNATYENLVNETSSDVKQSNILGETHNRSNYTPEAATPTLAPGDVFIDFMARDVTATDNDNANTTAITNEELNSTDCATGCRLTAGKYYLTELTLEQNDQLQLDTSSGGIDIYVDGPFQVEKADITVIGDGRVNIAVDSTDPGQTDLLLDRTPISIPGDRAPQLWIFLRADEDADARIEGGTGTDPKIDGVIYGASGNQSGGAVIEMDQGAEVYGAVVGDVRDIRNSAEVHFDRALLRNGSVTAGQPVVRWLHVLFRVAEIGTD